MCLYLLLFNAIVGACKVANEIGEFFKMCKIERKRNGDKSAQTKIFEKKVFLFQSASYLFFALCFARNSMENHSI